MPKYMSLEHGSTVVVTNNESELFSVLDWCEMKQKLTASYMHNVINFPMCFAVDGDVVGWTNQMDRALYYKPFAEFLSDIT